MPDQPDLTPEQEQEVRRLLADARHTEPMPADVATRLDRVLADLAAQHGDTSPDDGTDSVVAMASRRRRRVTSLLVAAAAVVAVGVGLDQVVDTGGSGDSASTADRAQVAESAGSGSGRGKDEPKPNTDSLTGSAPAPEMAFARPGPGPPGPLLRRRGPGPAADPPVAGVGRPRAAGAQGRPRQGRLHPG